MTIIPAYGRDYNNSDDILKDFNAGKDFMISDISSKYNGRYCSIRDFKKDGIKEVTFRYSRLTKSFTKEL